MGNAEINRQKVRQTSARFEGWRGLTASFPVMIGFVPFALVLGAQASQKGFSVLEVPLMTGLNFGGGSEFAALKLWTAGRAAACSGNISGQ